MSFIGKLTNVITMTKSAGGFNGNTELYTNNTLLSNNKTYLVTAEVTFSRPGSGQDSILIYFTNGDASNANSTFIGIPVSCGFWGDAIYDAYWSSGKGSITSLIPRNSAQAVITNGKIKLVCVSNADDVFSFEIHLYAIECSYTSI
jgi:hypothetical protein